MSYFNTYTRGDWKAICDICGREFKASKLKQRWDGLMTCQKDWEPRQPQDFVRGVPDPQLVPWNRNEAIDRFVAMSSRMALNLVYTSLCSISTIIRRQYVTTATPINKSVVNANPLG